MATTAQTVLLPPDPSVFRVVFLYVGQGESTLLILPDAGNKSKFALVDINRGEAQCGMDVVAMLSDLLPKKDGKPVLDLFINTHPHSDHLRGVDELRARITVKEIWHTGFEPSDRHEATYKEFTSLIDDVRKAGGPVIEYRGTRDERSLGKTVYNVLSPADHTKEEIDKLEGEERDRRIHDYCGVMRFGYGTQRRYVLLTGDADRRAWAEYILGPTEYHKDRMPSEMLSAPHHGSRDFFKNGEDDKDPYTRHIEIINPVWVVISSPRQKDSPHGHPHDDALDLYQEHVRDKIAANVHVLGERPESLIYDVYQDGEHVLDSDDGQLVDAYPLCKGDDTEGKGEKKGQVAAPYVITSKLDKGRPMGCCE